VSTALNAGSFHYATFFNTTNVYSADYQGGQVVADWMVATSDYSGTTQYVNIRNTSSTSWQVSGFAVVAKSC